jgi:CheY-like chemotaxis protein
MKKVLLVEDDFDNATLVEDIFAFEDLHAELVITQTGEEALRLAAELQPELILMDLQLPGMGGLDATRALKRERSTAHIPVWAVTASAMKGDAELAKAAGCSGYFTKPICTRELTDELRAALGAADVPGND